MNKNLIFTLKFILALIPILAFIGFIALCPNCYMDEEYPAWRYTKEYVENRGNDADILILGDSRAMADLIPAILTQKNEDAQLDDVPGDASKETAVNSNVKSCVNLAVGGATPVEMYYFYVDYLRNHKAPETAVVMFAPFHYSYMDNYKTRTLYFNALSEGDYHELLKVAMRYNAESVLFEDQAAYHLSCALRLPDVYLPAIYNAGFIGRKADNEARFNSLAASCGQGYFGTDEYNADKAYEASYTEMKESGDADLLRFYSEALYTLLSKSCERVILVQPPMNETTFDSLDDNYVAEYRTYIDDLCSGFDNFTYSTEFERYDNEYFGDASHLNKRGAEKYSGEFVQKYKSIL